MDLPRDLLSKVQLYERKEREFLKNDPKSKAKIREAAIGKEVEKEHTKSDSEALKIAQDHLQENEKYYTDPKKGLKTIDKDAAKISKRMGA
jgi:hypothetical protein